MNDACYASSNGKIYGAVGPYVVQYNGDTGAREGFVRVTSPVMGDIRLCYHAATNSLYAATLWQTNLQWWDGGQTYLHRNIFPVSLGLVAGARIDLDAIHPNLPPYGGFEWIGSNGNYLYVVASSSGNTGTPSSYGLIGFDPTNTADNASSASIRFRPQNCGFSPTQIASPNPSFIGNNSQISVYDLAFTSQEEVYVLPHNPCAVEYCPASSKFYAVCGDTNLLRVDTILPANGTFTTLNLGAVEASADPYRIRYWSGTGRLYLPCPTANGVIVWNPNTETGEFKSGFDNPIDVVFTSSKAWAVQNARVGLREIT